MLSYFGFGGRKQNKDNTLNGVEEKKDEKENEDTNCSDNLEDEDKQNEKQAEKENEELESIEPAKEEVLLDFEKSLYVGYIKNISQEQIFERVNNFSCIENSEKSRCERAYYKGGGMCIEESVKKKLRSIGKEMLKAIGKKLLSGSLQLTKISFPIKCCIPQTVLETACHNTTVFPLYMNKAAATDNKLERFKLVIIANISAWYYTNTFYKPLNPILGETLQATYPDGTTVYAEQICHHPPITYILTIGNNDSYRYWGYYDVDARAGLNSLTLNNKGKRTVKFKDGQLIQFSCPKEVYCGTWTGQLRQETSGEITFKDEKNNLKVNISLGKVRHQPSDYFESDIYQGDKPVSKIQGTYMGYINIDDKCYWDYKTCSAYRINIDKDTLPSDHKKRQDLKELEKGNVAQGQKEKVILEELQRKDAKGRKQSEKEKEF